MYTLETKYHLKKLQNEKQPGSKKWTEENIFEKNN